MPKPRKEQVSLEATLYYHYVSRCVRKAFLCGVDNNTNGSYEHRRAWLENKLLNQAQNFVDIWRTRLMDIGWFISRLNEKIARQASYENQCTGRFWDRRFKSQALLDEKALAACMVYVDLNPVRAKMAKTPEKSEHTSVKTRSEKAKTSYQPNHPNQQANKLMPFVGNQINNLLDGLSFRLTNYLALIDLTGRAIHEDKRGHIEKSQQDILIRLGIEPNNWLTMTQEFEKIFKDLVGNPSILDKTVKLLNRKRRLAFKNCEMLLA